MNGVPEPVLADHPRLVELYRVAWEQAGEHVVSRAGIPRSPYMDEGFDPSTLWIWDTCFMAHFCKYAPAQFPGIESLDNFYRPMYDGEPTALRIHHPDNPPLFAWTEEEYVRHTGDLTRVEWLLHEKRYLQRHFEFFDNTPVGSRFPYSNIPTTVSRGPRGYGWDGVCSGMDNTPRAPVLGEHGSWGDIHWFDAAAQQALAARSISRLAMLVGDDRTAAAYEERFVDLRTLLDTFWDDADQIYYDRFATAPHDFHRVRTPAAYWPLLAGACSPAQAAALAAKLSDPSCFGGPVPWPSVARDDKAFRPDGMYWRGGVWVPMAYVSARALAEHGHHDLAREATLTLLNHMADTYAAVAPHTIWEAYSPSRPAPATAKDDHEIVRPHFCGWSALAPISMLIEHVLGFRVDAPAATVTWRRPAATTPVGIQGLRCGGASLDAVAASRRVTVTTDAPLTLVVDGQSRRLTAGTHTWPVPS
jgi:glycogen debranching enzyme